MQVIVLTLFSMLMWSHGVVDSVRIVDVRVAAHMAAGSDALLGCNFDMGDETLYSLKWYKDEKEFFRYVPKAEPKMKSFFVSGVMVDLNRSSVNVVALKRLTQESAGKYQCEVRAEAPSFEKASQEKEVIIDVLPRWGPVILGLQEIYHLGSQLTVNCTTAPSRPEASLTWLINGRPAPADYLSGPFYLIPTDRPYTYQPKLMLNFTVQAEHFDAHGTMTLKCQATIPPLYHQEKECIFYETIDQTTTTESSKRKDPSSIGATTGAADIPFVLFILQMILLLLIK